MEANKSSNPLMSANSTMMTDTDVWTEMLDNQELLKSQYDVVAGQWPTKFNEIVLIVSEDNEISDYALYSLGIKDVNELDGVLDKIKKLGYPVVVKPATLGSSVGITLVHDSKKIEDAIAKFLEIEKFEKFKISIYFFF